METQSDIYRIELLETIKHVVYVENNGTMNFEELRDEAIRAYEYGESDIDVSHEGNVSINDIEKTN